MVNVIYEPAIFHTNDEYLSVPKEKVDIQREVVKSVLYLLASCPADDSELMWGNTRMENKIDLSNFFRVTEDINTYKGCCFFKGGGVA